MKKTILITIGLILSLTSCMKTKTCNCYDNTGDLSSSFERSSNKKSELKELEDACHELDAEKRSQSFGYCTVE
jgi:hypothetical protein